MSFNKPNALAQPPNGFRSGLIKLGHVDSSSAVLLNRTLHLPGIQRFFAAISILGNGRAWYAVMIWIILAYPDSGKQIVLHALLTGAANLLVYKVCKRYTHRRRPYAAMDEILLGACPLDQYSFPSGHTMHAVAFSLLFAHYFPVFIYVGVAFTVCIALSRVILGLHYPSDVLWGACLGFAVAQLSLMVWL